MKTKSVLLVALTFSIFSNSYCSEEFDVDAYNSIIDNIGNRENGLELNGKSLSGANTREYHFLNAYLEKANLQETDFSYGLIDRGNFKAIEGYKTSFQNTSLKKSNFEGAYLIEANFKNAHLSNSIFSKANLTRANLSSSDYLTSKVKNAYFNIKNFIKKVLGKNENIHPQYIKRLKEVTTRDVSFENSISNNASFANRNLYNVKFNNSDLIKTNFSNTKMVDVSFNNTNLSGATFNGADLTEVTFRNAKVEGTTFYNATGLTEGQIDNLKDRGAIFESFEDSDYYTEKEA